jgi:hypothetical protein
MYMIKWNSNFQIPESTTQTAVCFVKINTFVNKSEKCIVDLDYWDEYETWVFKQDQVILDSNFTNEEDIYNALAPQFPDSIVIE